MSSPTRWRLCLTGLVAVSAATGVATGAAHGTGVGSACGRRGTPAQTDPVRTRQEIDSRLRAMEAATLAGDRAAYLACVWKSDPIFFTEQENWAADFEFHVPTAFSLSLGEADPVEAEGWAECELTMRWAMEGKPEREVSWPARFVETEEGWLYAGEKWSVVKGDRVEVRCAPGLEDVARHAVDVFPEVRAHVEPGFELEVPGDQQIKMYGSMTHLQASIYLSYEDGLSGWNEPGEAIKILSAGPGGGKFFLKVLLAHEFGHVCTFVMGDKATGMPWWVAEGVAELAAEKFASGDAAARIARRWARRGGLAPWDQMADFRNTPDKYQMHVYKQGQAMVGYISERFGRTARNGWLRELTRGATLEEASAAALGVSFAQIDKDWRATLTEEPAPKPEEAPGPPG